jgi:hypothetical protein
MGMVSCIVIVTGGSVRIDGLVRSVRRYARAQDKVEVVHGRENLSRTWNIAVEKCLELKADSVVLLNDDITIGPSFRHLLLAMDTGPSTVYSCTSNAAPWGNYIHQQEYIHSTSPVWRTHSAYKWPRGPGGFVIGLPHTIVDVVRNRTRMIYNESVPWGGNEAEFNGRLVQECAISLFVIVHSCFVQHTRRNSWLRRTNAWKGSVRNR